MDDMFQFGNIDVSTFNNSWEPADFELLNVNMPEDYCPSANSANVAGSTESEKETVDNAKKRRRAQNRASQRAFRERKEKHIKGLEYQLENLNEMHQDLLQSYHKQANHIEKLNRRISQLQAEIKTVKPCNGQKPHSHTNSHPPIPDSFDAFSFTSNAGLQLYNSTQTPKVLDCINSTLRAKPSLPSFEDLLCLP
ncbi:uncharacterized protein Z518_00552 [Rhinocladiella mackenziei CBS 650.93]|uniref:Putative transcription factor kapC n=1 Tax=Rhinocladiella mackenziei CBS 650.93 TaxID=1442369 RepID=A0A0D2G494_9EURO|nr:uncharacterized protein Z518_00552 [Rhinocladiella mackenziei CBS 650.93]KIX09472.1 hypothetical protein Z518_00552 [Rhinocladiella mackenziei CBS 650.93]